MRYRLLIYPIGCVLGTPMGGFFYKKNWCFCQSVPISCNFVASDYMSKASTRFIFNSQYEVKQVDIAKLNKLIKLE